MSANWKDWKVYDNCTTGRELNWNFITANAQTMSFLYNSPQRFWIFMSKTSINFLVSLFWFFTANFVTKSKFDKALNIITRAFKWSIRLVQWIPEMWGKMRESLKTGSEWFDNLENVFPHILVLISCGIIEHCSRGGARGLSTDKNLSWLVILTLSSLSQPT